MERLQKVMAEAGVDSRRHCEEMIEQGLVKVNGKTVRKLPVFVDTEHDRITVAGRKLRFEPKVYYLLHKPKKVVCTSAEKEGRLRAIDLMKGVKYRVYPVGRLDTDSKGLLLMTNDGEMANQLTHPRYGVAKTYLVEVEGWVKGDEINKLKKGLWLEQGRASMESVQIRQRNTRRTILEIVLKEGQNRQIRKMLSRLGHSVKSLTRTQIGPLSLHGLGPGKYRPLKPGELKALRKNAGRGKQDSGRRK